MESKVKALGHPIHPMLVVFPLGLFVASVLFDVVYLATANSEFSVVAFWCIAGGVLGGLAAALFGWIDWFAIPEGTRAKAVGLWHGGGNMVVTLLFVASWLMRWNTPGYTPSMTAFLTSLVAVGIGAVTGWLGGELVDRLGVGVDPDAHLNAPNSLSGRPAHEDATTPEAARPAPSDRMPRAA